MTAETVKAAVRLEDVVEKYTKLTGRNGRDLFYRCPEPIHGKQDRTPSFTVTQETQLFHCFGCGASGDVFSFIQKIEGLTFVEAVRYTGENFCAGFTGLTGSGTAERYGGISGGAPFTQGAGKRKPASAPVQPEEPAEKSPRGPCVATYDYVDENGKLLYQSLRFEPGENGRKKDFLQRQPKGSGWDWSVKDVGKVWYNLPSVIEADEVVIAEGEKDCATLTEGGYVATTNCGGCNGEVNDEMIVALSGKRVVILPDQDENGKKRGIQLEIAIREVASCVQVHVPKGKDVTEYFELGYSGEDLNVLISTAWRNRREEEFRNRGLLTVDEIAERAGGPATLLGGKKKGLQYGYSRLDQMTLGMHGGELIILAARPSMGKTGLAMCIAANVARRGQRVGFFSLEMSDESLLSRLICSEARVDQLRFRGGFLSADERMMVQAKLYEISQWPLRIDDEPGATVAVVRNRLITAKDAGQEIGLVIIDYLQLMDGGGRRSENRNQEVSAISRGLKLVARELDVPFLVLSQLSRAADTRTGDHVPQLSDLRDSGSIEQDADIVMFIYREEMYKRDREDLKGLADIIIAKQRNGPVGKVPLRFIGPYTRFENASDMEAM